SVQPMSLVRLYLRVLATLGPQARMAWGLALANLALAASQFAEPVLFARVVDALTATQGAGEAAGWARLAPLLAYWAAFGLFNILCGTVVALYSDQIGRAHV